MTGQTARDHTSESEPSLLQRPRAEKLWQLAHLEEVLRKWLFLDRETTARVKAAAVFLGLIILVALIWFIANEYTLRTGVEELSGRVRQQQETLEQVRKGLEDIARKVEILRSSIEGELTMAERISTTYGPSVSLIEATYQFVERGTGRVLRYATATESGIAITQGDEKFQVTVEGSGPAVEETVIGTGFLVARGFLLTNLHVARPWWQNEAAEQLIAQGFEPRLISLHAYFPNVRTPLRLEVARSSEEYDLALCRFPPSDINVPIPPLADKDVKVEVGQPVVLLGYPAGIEAMLARLDETVARQIITTTAMRAPDVARELATRGLIRPLVTQGHVSARLPSRIVHDAATTTGGSGGPLFNRSGVVVGINYAVLREFSASNLAVPAHLALKLLQEQGIAP
ncbi:MAG TPA: serine protease [Blastocatellia bacterium]|nr:serine protease [Blastocatellia bacterium]